MHNAENVQVSVQCASVTILCLDFHSLKIPSSPAVQTSAGRDRMSLTIGVLLFSVLQSCNIHV